MNILKSTPKKKTVKKDILGNTVIEDDKGNKKTIKKDFPQFKMLHDKTKEHLQNSHDWLPASVGF